MGRKLSRHFVDPALWPSLTKESALAVNGRFPIDGLTLDDLSAEAATWPLDRDDARAVATETLERLREAADLLDSERLATIVAARCDALLAGRGAGARR